MNTTAIKLNKTTTWNRALTINSDVSSKTNDNIQILYFTPNGISGSASIIETSMFGNWIWAPSSVLRLGTPIPVYALVPVTAQNKEQV